MPTVRPLHNRIAVRLHKPPELSPGGIYVGVQEDTGFVKEIVRGEVVAVGPGLDKHGHPVSADEIGVKTGDVITFSPVLSQAFKLDDEEFTMINRDAIVGVEVQA